ncbi:hypothetical protein [Arthrobacter sp. CAN_C5]|uniref:hypothetical protein n=1 Tax=Arthrobacter sp. CAN_C5 TaxID=2760706 RepID=UPI001AE2B89E|nr:hypothetical protein [Arthrobacter sp. CAN_C5]MBP2215987.1 hypothetical protein [Arthrobacter sp. CAN_C5]
MTSSIARQPQGIPVGGQFAATSHPEAGVTLAPVLPLPVSPPVRHKARSLFDGTVERETTDGAEVEHKHPATKSEARRLLSDTRGEKGDRVRQVHQVHQVHQDDHSAPDSDSGEHVDIVGPADGRPIIVTLSSGMARLRVASRKAIIKSDSAWGNVVTGPISSLPTSRCARSFDVHQWLRPESRIVRLPRFGNY